MLIGATSSNGMQYPQDLSPAGSTCWKVARHPVEEGNTNVSKKTGLTGFH